MRHLLQGQKHAKCVKGNATSHPRITHFVIVPTMNPMFQPTQWTLILNPGNDAEHSRQALEHLCSAYWKPLYACARSLGQSHEDAQDTVQGYLAHVIESNLHENADRERGRFRTFMLLKLRNYISKQHRSATAQKRGGSEALHLSLNQTGLDLQHELPTTDAPDILFDKKWALAVLEQAMLRLEDEQSNAERFAAFKPSILDEERGNPQDLVASLGMNDGAVRTTLSRLRARYRELIRAEVRRLVADEAEVEDELHHLMCALAG